MKTWQCSLVNLQGLTRLQIACCSAVSSTAERTSVVKQLLAQHFVPQESGRLPTAVLRFLQVHPKDEELLDPGADIFQPVVEVPPSAITRSPSLPKAQNHNKRPPRPKVSESNSSENTMASAKLHARSCYVYICVDKVQSTGIGFGPLSSHTK